MFQTNHQKHRVFGYSLALLLLLVAGSSCLEPHDSDHNHNHDHNHDHGHDHDHHHDNDQHEHHLSSPMAPQQQQQQMISIQSSSQPGPTASLVHHHQHEEEQTTKPMGPDGAGQILSTKPKEDSTASTITITTDPKQLFAQNNAPKVIIDLSHPLENQTLYWPSLPSGFKYESFADGERQNERNESYYVKSDGFRMGVHCGTHLDAPKHFNKNGWTVEQIPLDRLINVPVTVIDVSELVSTRRNYSFVKSDFFNKDTNQTMISHNSVVLMYTGISKLYDQGAEAYFGTKGTNISEMYIPGFSQEAAEYLVSMGVYGVGLDAASADSSEKHGSNNTIDPIAHKIFNGNNVYILENVNNKLAELLKQTTPMSLIIAPLPIKGGSGSPVRLIAVSSSHGLSESALSVGNSGPSLLGIDLLPSRIALALAMLASTYLSWQKF